MLKFKPIWFDSLGAKSSCCLIQTPDASILIDPGIAAMQRSFPASDYQKALWKKEGYKEIKKAAEKADIIIITHYHYDHFKDFDKQLYQKKLIFAKNPNIWINDSQRKRAFKFYSKYVKTFGKKDIEDLLKQPQIISVENPLENLPIALAKDFGSYNKRRAKLLKKGEKWFFQRVKNWKKYPQIPELNFSKEKVKWADKRSFQIGSTKIRFSPPLFHGIEFSRVGWILSVIIETKNKKFLYSSDMNGPIIEDYAQFIIKENPDILVLDGPMTYMLGYTLNLINFKRTIENAKSIFNQTTIKLIIYDHHLTREPHFRERTKEIWSLSSRKRKILTAAEYLGKKPVVECLKKTS